MAVDAQTQWWRPRPAEPLRRPGLSMAVGLPFTLLLSMALFAVTRDISDGTRWTFVHVGGAVFGGATFLADRLRSRPVARGCVHAVAVAAMVAGFMLGQRLVGYFSLLIELAWGLAVCYALLGAVELGRRSARSS